MVPRESIGLTSQSPYLDNEHGQSKLRLLDSDALLERPAEPSSEHSGATKPLKPGRELPPRALGHEHGSSKRTMMGRRKCTSFFIRMGVGILVVLGVIQLLRLAGALIVFVLPGDVHDIVGSWGKPGRIGANLATWPTDFSRDIFPIPCHSHNDYWRRVPLYSAIEAGCIGVEADVWLFDDELYVGHSIPSLTRNRTLNSLYIDPLLSILSKQNPKHTLISEDKSQPHGVFDTEPDQSLILLIDFKTAGRALWPHVQKALDPLRKLQYLTRYNESEIISGPIIAVGTGNTPFDMVISDVHNPDHDIFFDAPLADMYSSSTKKNSLGKTRLPSERRSNNAGLEYVSQKRSDEEGQGNSGTTGISPDAYNISNSYYASVSFGSTIGYLWDGKLSKYQLGKIRGQIKAAHDRGLKARYWDLPFWPINLRNHIWDVLIKEGIDLLNVDDLRGATKTNWDKRRGWWKRGDRISTQAQDIVEESA